MNSESKLLLKAFDEGMIDEAMNAYLCVESKERAVIGWFRFGM